MKRSVFVTWAFALYALIIPLTVCAVDAPHYDPAAGITCATCHTGHLTLGSTGYNNICQSCHRPGNPIAGMNPFTPADQADPFGNHTSGGGARRLQISHRWDGTDIVPAAGARPPIQAAMTTSSLRARSSNQLACVRCHDQHSNTYGKFLRIPNDQDQLCLDCHRTRNVNSHLKGSHPVGISYDSARGQFNRPPVNSNPANPTSDLNARLAASGGKLLCTTCHGIHYTDSHSGTIDGRDNFTNLSSSDGNLLRTDRRGPAVFGGMPDRQNLCTNCHAGKKSHNQKSQDVQCSDCHGAHVEYDPRDPANSKGSNVYLIRRNVSKAGQPTQIFFRYTGSRREYKNDQGTGVCQGCHEVPPPGTLGAPPEHASNDPKVCNTCHFHNGVNGSFSGSCANCHGYPPIATTLGGPTGLANPGTNALGSAPVSPGAHAAHATGRMMTCNTCHNGYGAKAMPSKTIDIGFAINGGNFPGFRGTVTGGTLSGSNSLIGYSWSAGPGSTVTPVSNANTTCSVYCHGSTLTGGNNTTPSWTGAGQAACGSCHGVTPATAPTSGGHVRHAGSGAAGRLSIPCASCHGSHPDKSHVNGNVEWNLTALGPNAQYKTPTGAFSRIGDTGAIAPSSSNGQCSNIYCHSSVQGAGGIGAAAVYGQPAWGTTALACGSCHADMTGPSATGSHVIHAQVNAIPCASCHNGLGRDTASHANSNIDLAFSGSASGTVYSKGTSFVPGIGYGSCTTSCHLNKPITWGTTLPVNASCTGCHGGNAASGDVLATGMHAKHINQLQALSGNIACAECHNATVSLASDRVITTPANHANSTVNVIFARGGSYASGTCNATYCHGATLPSSNPARTAPSWNTPFPAGASVLGNGIAGGSNPGSGYCAQCHGYPPQDGHAASGCSSCHTHVNSDNLTFNNPSLHINGVVNALSSNCDSCHGYPPAKQGFVGTPGNWAGSKAENYPGGGGAHTIQNHVSRLANPADGFVNCSRCHNPADHQMSPVVFRPSQNIKVSVNQNVRFESARLARYTSNRLDASSHLTGTCSNISCHLGATPKWDPNQ